MSPYSADLEIGHYYQYKSIHKRATMGDTTVWRYLNPVMAHLNKLVEHIQHVEQTPWCIYEVQFAKRIGIKATTEQTAAGQVTERC